MNTTEVSLQCYLQPRILVYVKDAQAMNTLSYYGILALRMLEDTGGTLLVYLLEHFLGVSCIERYNNSTFR